MKSIYHYAWLVFLICLGGYGYVTFHGEWEKKVTMEQGEMVDVKIAKLNCIQQEMEFQFENTIHARKISARDCAVFNVGQKIKLKFNRNYQGKFVFPSEHRPNTLILGALEMILSLLGLIANWPFLKKLKSGL